MKAILGIFITFFLIFATLGFISGRAYIRKPTSLNQQAFQPLDLSCRRGSEEYGRGVCELIYTYEGKILYRFDTQTNTLNKTTDANRLELEKGFKPAFNLPIDETIIVALLGGSTAGFTIKDLRSSEALKKKKMQRIIAGILGGVSGYAVGFKLATLQAPGPESEEIKSILENAEEWRKYEKVFYDRVIMQTARMAQLIEDKNKSSLHVGLAAFLMNRADNKQDLETIEFLLLASEFNKTADLAFLDKQRSLDKLEDDLSPRWLNWLWLVALVMTLITLGGMVVRERMEQKAHKKENDNMQRIHLPTQEELEKFSKQTRK